MPSESKLTDERDDPPYRKSHIPEQLRAILRRLDHIAAIDDRATSGSNYTADGYRASPRPDTVHVRWGSERLRMKEHAAVLRRAALRRSEGGEA